MISITSYKKSHGITTEQHFLPKTFVISRTEKLLSLCYLSKFDVSYTSFSAGISKLAVETPHVTGHATRVHLVTVIEVVKTNQFVDIISRSKIS